MPLVFENPYRSHPFVVTTRTSCAETLRQLLAADGSLVRGRLFEYDIAIDIVGHTVWIGSRYSGSRFVEFRGNLLHADGDGCRLEGAFRRLRIVTAAILPSLTIALIAWVVWAIVAPGAWLTEISIWTGIPLRLPIGVVGSGVIGLLIGSTLLPSPFETLVRTRLTDMFE